jgi:DNA-binding NtrC family response regulator
MKLNILVIDDEPEACEILSGLFKRMGHNVETASDGSTGLNLFHAQDFNLVITDIRMPGVDGLELLKQIKQVEQAPVNVIVVTGHGDMDNAIKALKYGAYDYLLKPIDVRELTISVERLCSYLTLQEKYQSLKTRFRETVDIETQSVRCRAEQIQSAYLEEIGLDGLKIFSKSMREVVNQAERYSQDRQIPVLIQGESGTGKELIARFIHLYDQPNVLAPFVAINCGAISRDLFESELFGHEPGAFTGATARGKEGKLEAANGGTIFLDEIGEMPIEMQVKLLRALDDRKFYRVGGVKEIDLNIRVISATNKDLHKEVEERRFRLDLYFRINMGTIRIPPLRERREDILPLAQYFAKRSFLRRGVRFEGFATEAKAFLTGYSWPGNVRQLKNAMDRLAIMQPHGKVAKADLAFVEEFDFGSFPSSGKQDCLGRNPFVLPEDRLDLCGLEYNIVKMAMEKHRGNKSKTAEYLGISRKMLYNKLKKIGS